MNSLERKMVAVLTDLRENHHVNGVKAEFEAEGTRLEEAMRLKEVVSAAGIGLTIKIGGCEALRDIYECRVLGVARIVAPMIETAYALKKFLGAVKIAFPVEEREDRRFRHQRRDDQRATTFSTPCSRSPEAVDLDGIVLGRVDMTRFAGALAQRHQHQPEASSRSCRSLFTQGEVRRARDARSAAASRRRRLPFIARAGRWIDRPLRDAQGHLPVPRRRTGGRCATRASSRRSASS